MTGSDVREFETGATRDVNTDKLVYTGFLSAPVLKRYAEFMHRNRFQRDGKVRAADNWKKGIPVPVYMESLGRHFMEVWLLHDAGRITTEEAIEALCGVMFNSMGMMHELLQK